jgi:hypothetical protein
MAGNTIFSNAASGAKAPAPRMARLTTGLPATLRTTGHSAYSPNASAFLVTDPPVLVYVADMRPVPLRSPARGAISSESRAIQIDAGIVLLRLPATLAAADERVHRSDGAIQAVVLEVFCDNSDRPSCSAYDQRCA